VEYWNPELELKPWPEVERWQAPQVADTVDRIGRESSFYRGRIAPAAGDAIRARGLQALQDLPETRKDEFRRSQEKTTPGAPLGEQQAVPIERVVQIVSSSGTTGHPLYYGLTRADVDVWADVCANTFFTAGVRPGDVVAHLVGLPMVAGGMSYADGYRRLGATLAWLGGFPTERILNALPRLQATALLATTSFGLYLTESCESLVGRPASSLGIRKLQLGGEPGMANPEIRARIKAGWGTDHVREGMGLADVLAAMWSECEHEGGMHFNGQRAVAVELLDPSTGRQLPWRPGATGEIAYTTFAREATPVLRYRSADHVLITAVDCACGRTSPRLVVVGRTDDMLIYKGMNVYPTAIRDIVTSRFGDRVEPHVRIWKDRADQVQFLSPIPVEVEARHDLDPATWPAVAETLAADAREHLQVRLAVTLVPPGTLPRSVHKTPLVAVRPAGEA
jgi:phenylacetate-coenzyme A ligase PaaK-like adenylate-forming protein